MTTQRKARGAYSVGQATRESILWVVISSPAVANAKYQASEIQTGCQCSAVSQGLSRFITSPSNDSLMSTVTTF